MNEKSLKKAIELAKQVGYVLVATADEAGLPHVAAACEIADVGDGMVSAAEWFCPGTIENVKHNRNVSLVVWDKSSDKGYQLFGTVQQVEDIAVMDGYAPELETGTPMPQIERKLIVKVGKVVLFSHAPHSDVEEETFSVA